MRRFSMFPLRNNNVVELFRIRDEIDIDPVYQRISVWDRRKQQLFIDSVINQVDVPKIYLHQLAKGSDGADQYRYSVIDGKQRLLALWGFMENKIQLARDFEFFDDSNLQASGATYDILLSRYPILRGCFDSFDVPTIVVQAEDERVIEDLFTRLNVAVPLSAPEYRNALGGPIPLLIRRLARSSFFEDNVTVNNKRFQHYDLAVKFLYLTRNRGFNSTKRDVLNRFVENYRDAHLRGDDFASWESVEENEEETGELLGNMASFFRPSDPLLGSQGRVTLLFHTFRLLSQHGLNVPFTRDELGNFKVRVDDARRKSQRMSLGSGETLDPVESQLVNFDREKQSINDGGAVKRQYGYFSWYLSEVLSIGLPDPD